jgi:hypothetical protein
MPDIDIDFRSRNEILNILPHRTAQLPSGKKHNTGVYVTEIPHNPVNNQATIDHKEAEQRGYFKLDFLNVSIYEDIRNDAHLQKLMKKEPLWELLKYDEFVNQLFHLKGHGKVTRQHCPTSVEQLAAVLAMIRPAKRHLIGTDWTTILNHVWTKPENGEYHYKRSHATAYAVTVKLHMNLLCEQLNSEVS